LFVFNMVAHFKVIKNKHLKLKIPSNTMVMGSSGSGKTMYVLKLIKFVNHMFRPRPKNIVYAYGHDNNALPKLKKMGVIIHKGLPSDKYLANIKKPMILILDDLMLQADKHYLDNLFTVKSHHENIAVIKMVQNAFHKNLKTLRDNCHYFFLFNSPAAKRQIRDFGVNVFPQKYKNFLKIFENVVKSKYEPLFIDLQPNTDEDLRLRSKILPNQITEVYKP